MLGVIGGYALFSIESQSVLCADMRKPATFQIHSALHFTLQKNN